MEFWEKAFIDKQTMWGFEPAQSAVIANAIFIKNELKKLLIPGIGYGRNAKIFLEHGMQVSGIEISKTAIEIAHQTLSKDLNIIHGSVTEVSLDQFSYDAVFCHGLLYLLEAPERKQLIEDCYAHLDKGGIMIFTVINQNASNFGQGKKVGESQFEMYGGVRLYFYDLAAVYAEFNQCENIEVLDVTEDFPFYLIICRK